MTIQDGWNFESVGLDAQPPGGKGEGESSQGEGYRGRALLHPSKPPWFPHSFLADCCLFRTLEDIDQVKRFVFWAETLLGGSHLTRQLFPNSSSEADVIFDQLFGNNIGVMKSDQLLFLCWIHMWVHFRKRLQHAFGHVWNYCINSFQTPLFEFFGFCRSCGGFVQCMFVLSSQSHGKSSWGEFQILPFTLQ